MIHKTKLSKAIKYALFATLAFPVTVFAQDNDEKKENKALDFEKIVVTGSSKGISQMDASYAITVLPEEAIQKLAPLNMADLIGKTPGIFTESTGGEVKNIYRVRGIPDEGDFASFQEEGLPSLGYSGVFVDSDVAQRVDIMTSTLEVVRGGPSPIFADNAVAIFNNISRRGTEISEGAIRAAFGTSGLARLDSYWSGQVGDNTSLAVGGFVRINDGYRDSGFRADEGGQFRFNLTTELEDGGTFNVYGRYLDDKNLFYLPMPLADSTGKSVSHLIDPLTDTLNSPYLQGVNLVSSDGNGGQRTEHRDLSNGRHINVMALGFEYEKQLNDTWYVSSKMRYSDITLNFDALYSGRPMQNAQTYADSYLDKANDAWGGTVDSFAYQYAVTGGSFDPATTDNFVIEEQFRTIKNDSFNFVSDTRFTATLDDHNVTIGGFYFNYGEKVDRRYMMYLFEMQAKPQPLNLIAYDAQGTQLGSVTKNGVSRQGAYAFAYKEEAEHIALYVTDEWQITDKLRIDTGLRYRHSDYTGGRYGNETVNLGDNSTLADDAVIGITSVFNPSGDSSNTNLAWTVGANYALESNLSVYARMSNSTAIGSLAGLSGGGNDEDTEVEQYELGLKYDTDNFNIFATAFYATYEPVTDTFNIIEADGNTFDAVFSGNTEAPGIEVLTTYAPIEQLMFTANVTYTEPELSDLKSLNDNISAVAPDGNRIRRQPKEYGYLSADYFFNVLDADATATIRYNYVGERFVDYKNSTVLPAYHTINFVANLNWDEWTLQVSVDNLTNEIGVTEGNPRGDIVSGQGTPEVNYGRSIFGRSATLQATYRF
tara:strand:+ start:9676 stop:12147 length:2472 start_codon:yes stop_codon:yes gene_type:complete